jgi:hypothetical protein
MMATADTIEREFLECLAGRAHDGFNGHVHEAFVAWYVEAEFGTHVRWEFTDAAGDGGLDAVVWRPNETPPVVLLQSKFKGRLGANRLGASAYAAFRNVVEAFRYGDEAFDDFLEGVRDDAKSCYRRALDRLRDLNWAHAKKAFRLVTTASAAKALEFDLVPQEGFVYAPAILRIYDRFRRGFPPPPRPLQLTVSDKMEYLDRDRGMRSYLFNARVCEFRNYFRDCDVARLVARNIRYSLPGAPARRIARDIRRSYEKNPKDFWYFHNGLTIICDKFLEENGVATLTNPSVINGAQTLYAISSSRNLRSPALATVRVIVRGTDAPLDDDDWLQHVIRGVNTQNPVKQFDFASNEPEQVVLEHLFREHRVFYERKRGEWREFRNDPQFRGFARLSLRDLGVILTAVSEKNGEGVLAVKRGLGKVFDEKHYRKLFPSRSKVARRFRRIYLAHRLFEFLRRYGYQDAGAGRKQRHGRWNCLWLLFLGISRAPGVPSRCTLTSIRDGFDVFESRSTAGAHARSVLRRVTRAAWQAWRKAKRGDPERWTANNFFKSPFGNKQLLRLALPRVGSDMRWLGDQLVAK